MSFTHKDISEAGAREELATKHGRLATPTLVIGDRVFLGFKQNREEIEKIIKSIIRGDNV